MATFKPKIPLLDSLITQKPPQAILEASNVFSKAMRFKTLLDRETRGFQKVDRKGPITAYEHEKPGVFKPQPVIVKDIPGYTHERVNRREAKITNAMTDRVSIIDIDAISDKAINTFGTAFYDYVELPFVPRELSYSMSSKFVGIATLGRNNPYYQFTGSEDTLTFEIDWFSNQPNRKDVINNCRWMEALTKSDGYLNPPHRVILSWGSDNLLWQDDIWVVTAAPYRLTDFNRGYRKVMRDKVRINPRGEFISTSMLPQQAY